MKRTIPHPSITGLASGAIIANYLNQGHSPGTTVIGALRDSNLELAAGRLLDYSTSMITSTQGRKAIVSGAGIAIVGTAIRCHDCDELASHED